MISWSICSMKYGNWKKTRSLRRVVFLGLTKKGIRAYEHHREYHREMTDAVIGTLSEEEIPVLVKTLKGLADFFRGYKDRAEN